MPTAPEPESSASGAKRARSKSPSPAAAPKTKRRKVQAVKKKRRDQVGSQSRRMKKDAIPEEARTLIAAFYLHLRLLWGLLSAIIVPEPPEDAIIDTFEAGYTSFDDILQVMNSPNVQMTTNENLIDRVGELRADPTSTSRTAQQASRISESALHHVLVVLSMYGLRAWRPNFLDDAYSTYNSAHRFIALETFRQLVVSCQYDHMAVNKQYLDRSLLLTRAYDHFVHYRMKRAWEKETKYPGVAAATAERNVILARRRKLARSRRDWAKTNHYPKSVQKTVGNLDATSDDEEGVMKVPGTDETIPVFWINEKIERSKKWTKFVRYIDKARRAAKEHKGGNRKTPVAMAKKKQQIQERIRVLRKKPSKSTEPLPLDVGLDWYDVEKFNALDIAFRAQFTPTDRKKPFIALPESYEECVQQRPLPAWRKLDGKQFMKKHGDALLAKYEIPDEVPDDADDSDLEEIEEDLRLEDAATLAQKQKAFAQAAGASLGPTEPRSGSAASAGRPNDKGKQKAPAASTSTGRPIKGMGSAKARSGAGSSSAAGGSQDVDMEENEDGSGGGSGSGNDDSPSEEAGSGRDSDTFDAVFDDSAVGSGATAAAVVEEGSRMDDT